MDWINGEWMSGVGLINGGWRSEMIGWMNVGWPGWISNYGLMENGWVGWLDGWM